MNKSIFSPPRVIVRLSEDGIDEPYEPILEVRRGTATLHTFGESMILFDRLKPFVTFRNVKLFGYDAKTGVKKSMNLNHPQFINLVKALPLGWYPQYDYDDRMYSIMEVIRNEPIYA